MRTKTSGFTLIEVVITLVVVSVLITMVYTFFGSSFTNSAAPITRMGDSLKLQTVIENITADYLASAKTIAALATLKTSTGAEGSVQNNNYGQYTVVDNHYIKFVSNAEALTSGADPLNLLKVTLKYSSGETLTALYYGS